MNRSVTGNKVGRPRLSRHAILEAALRLVDRDGAEALSMRRLGQELGVEAMSLYTHIAGRAELLNGLSEVMVEALPRAAAAGWRDSIRTFAHGIRNTAKRHPHAFLLVGMRPLRTVEALTPVEALLSSLSAAGFSPADAVSTYRLVVSFSRGFALAEIEGFTLDEEPEGPLSSTHPALAAIRATPGVLDHDMAFAAGLDAILSGLVPPNEVPAAARPGDTRVGRLPPSNATRPRASRSLPASR